MEKLSIPKDALRTFALGSALALSGLALSACSSDEYGNEPDNSTLAETTSGNAISHEYRQDGTRLTAIDDLFSSVLAYCDGHDLIEQTRHYKRYDSGSGNSIERSVEHPACIDGRLTPEDFKIPG